MSDRPNLDYEPCPPGVSHSRLGPPCEPADTAATATDVAPVSRLRHEMAGELAIHPDAVPAGRRASRRLHKWHH